MLSLNIRKSLQLDEVNILIEIKYKFSKKFDTCIVLYIEIELHCSFKLNIK